MAATPIPVRLTAEQIQRIDAVARKLGISRTGVIKMCLSAFLQRFERDGLSMLPTDWESILRDQDGRTHRYGQGGSGHRIIADNVAINSKGPFTQKKKSITTSPSGARSRRGAAKRKRKQ